jgi:Fe(3+) dicitrate transport protein
LKTVFNFIFGKSLLLQTKTCSVPERIFMFRFSSTLFVVLFIGLTANAQNYFVLKGRVVDSNGAVVPCATVTVTRTDVRFERTATTGNDGVFDFAGLIDGSYKVSVVAKGFGEEVKNITISNNTDSIELVLHPEIIAADVSISSSYLAGTEEALTRIPGAIENIGARTLENSRVFNFSEALRKISGVNIRDEEGFGLRPNIGIRGTNPTRSTKVLLLEDGMPLSYAPYGDNASYYHPPVERFSEIEVLKGSGQIQYGPATVAGVVNYITPNPPAKPAATIKLLSGNRNFFNGTGSFGGTWNKTGLLFNFTHKQGLGARENMRSRLDDFSFKALQQISERQTVILKTSYYDEKSNVTYSGLTQSEYDANPRQNPFRNDFFYGKRFGVSASHSIVFRPNLFLTTNAYYNYFKRDWWRQSSNSNERPNRLGSDADCRGMQDLNTTCGNQGRLRTYNNWGFEPRLIFNYNFGRVRNELSAGFRFHYENQDRLQKNGDFPTSRDGVLVESNIRRNFATSFFVQNRFIVGDFAITPGVRVEHIIYKRINRLSNANGKTELTQVVPGIGIVYNAFRNTTIFAGVHRGFAPPRTEDIISNTGGVIELNPELSWNYEVGVRTRPFAGLSFEGTYFRLDYENQIVPASLAGGVGATLTNGGATLQQGFEMNSQLDTGSVFKSKHNFYLRTAFIYLANAKFVGTRLSSISGFSNVSVGGNRVPYTPKENLTASFGYSHPTGIDAFIEANYVGRQFADDLNTINPSTNGQRGLIPSFTVFNATANYTVEKWKMTFFVTAKNLFDKVFIVDRTRGVLPGSPRLIQVGIKTQLFRR